MVGRSGIVFERCARGDGKRSQPPVLDERFQDGEALDGPGHMTGDQVHHRLPAALVRNVGRPDSREVHQQARGQMPRSSDARRYESQFTRLGPGQAEQFCDRTRRHVFVHGQHLRPDSEARDRRQVGQRVVARTRIQVRIDRHGADVHDDERVTVWRAACRRGSPQVSAGTGAVLDHDELTQGRSPAALPASAPGYRSHHRGRRGR